MAQDTPVTENARPGHLHNLVALAKVVVLVLLCIGVIDAAVRVWFSQNQTLFRIVDIQTPSVLYAKLEALREFDGIKVIILGDSLVYGRSMEAHGDDDWRRHVISRQLQERLAGSFPDRDLTVLNLGMNGALPQDLENLVRIIQPYKPDLLLFDLSLRSFSDDFEEAGEAETRPWLNDMEISGNGRLTTGGKGARLSSVIDDTVSGYWFLHRVSDFLQWHLLDGEPVNFTRNLRTKIDLWFKGGVPEMTRKEERSERAILMIKAKRRYSAIRLEGGNRQLAALQNMLEFLSATHQPTLIFYATENPGVLRQIVDVSKHRQDLEVLRRHIEDHADGRYIGYHPALESLKPGMFLDHVHLNAAGYAELADSLLPQATALIISNQEK